MPLEIIKKIDDLRLKIIQEEPSLATDLAIAGTKAILAGIGKWNEERTMVIEGTKEWHALMSMITKDSRELDRLCGKDEKFNQNEEWAYECLAYIAGDATCTAPTSWTTGTKRSMIMHPERKMDKVIDVIYGEKDEAPAVL